MAVDIVPEKVELINSKKSPIQDEYIEKYLAEKELKASQGLADYLKKNFAEPSVAIGYDSRIKSDVFAKVAAGVFAANGVKVNIWPVLMPVPTVSFATRYLHTSAGVMVTASHNPSKYNGYKVYAAHHAGVPQRHQGVRRQKGRQTAGLCAGSGWPAEIRRAQVPAGR